MVACTVRGWLMAAIPIEHVYDQIREFARARNVRCVVLFGSRARGTNLPKSDIDLAFSGGDAVGFEEDIQERLWSLLKVDIINLDEPISSELRHEIDRDGRVLYEAL